MPGYNHIYKSNQGEHGIYFSTFDCPNGSIIVAEFLLDLCSRFRSYISIHEVHREIVSRYFLSAVSFFFFFNGKKSWGVSAVELNRL